MLRRSRRFEAGEFLAEGAQAVREAIAREAESGGTVLELFVTEQAAARQVDLVRAALNARIAVTEVTPRAAAALSETQAPQGVIARCSLIDVSLADALGGQPRLVAVLVDANDPGNGGTVIRLADAAGADAVILAGDSVDAFNPKVVRASAGSLFHLPVARAHDPHELLAELATAGLATVATTGSADLELGSPAATELLQQPTAWLFGSESHGLPQTVIDAADAALRVPIYGRAESLNLATAAAICLYSSAGALHR